MQSELDCRSHGRYLFADQIFNPGAIPIIKQQVVKRHENREILYPFSYRQFINWEQKENEVILFTMYAYADFVIGKKFDCIFDLSKPSRHERVHLQLTQILYEGWLPTNYVDHGHKHICIFESELPSPILFNDLYCSADPMDYPKDKDQFQVGICRFEDYPEIKKYREDYLELLKIHGNQWLDHSKLDW